ncbi:MAG TPA: hypothetical protein VN922_05410, partial [Bacteroidia bacterium]|nr:hypothetical protein [Bacteroidia bacterium]
PQHWYYFNYVNGFMQVLSSNNDFMTSITALKSDKREQKTDKGKYTFGTLPTNSNKKTIFLRKFSTDNDNGGGGN